MSYIIAPTTAAATSGPIDCTRGPFPKTVLPVGDFSTDGAIAVKYYDAETVQEIDENTAVSVLYDALGDAVVIGPTSQPMSVSGPIILQFVKTISSSTNEYGVKLVTIGA